MHPFSAQTSSLLTVHSRIEWAATQTGSVTFGTGDASTESRSIARLAAGPPRIAVLFHDLDPSRPTASVRTFSGGQVLDHLTFAFAVVGIDRFGASAPAEKLYDYFGLTAEKIAPQVLAALD